MSPAELAKEIEAGRFKPVYYFCGAEDYRIKEAKKAFASRFLPKAQQGSNRISLSAAKTRIEDILTELSMIPMLGERQLFIIDDIQSLTPKQIERLFSILEPPDPNRVVILSSPSAKTPNKKSKFYKLMSNKTILVDFPRFVGNSAKKKIRHLLNQKNIEIDPDAVDLLVEFSGGDMGGLIGEVNKLIDYAGEQGRITKEDIAAISSNYQTYKIFELAGMATRGQYDEAIQMINFLVGRGERLTGLLFWLGEHFIGLYLAKNGRKLGSRDESWKYKGQLHLFENNQLEHIIRLIALADYDLRRQLAPQAVVERLIYEICFLSKKNEQTR